MEMTKSKERNVPYFAKRFLRLLEGILPLWKKKELLCKTGDGNTSPE